MLNKQLADCVEKHSLTAGTVAETVGCSRAAVGHWKTSHNPVSEKYCDKVTEYIGCHEWCGTAGPVMVKLPELEPDRQHDRKQAERFLTILDEDAEEFTFQTFDDSGRKRKNLARVLHGTLEDHWEQLARLNSKGAGIYVTVNETDLRGRKEENIIRIRSIWIEDDDGLGVKLPTSPHIIIESSPGHHHKYILTDSTNLDEFKPVQQILVDQYGSCPGAKDLPRVLRVPGFLHLKDPDNPFPVRIINESGEQPLTWDEVKKLFSALEQVSSDPFKDIPSCYPKTDIAEHTRAIHTGENYNNSLCSLSSSLAAQGLDKGLITAMLEGIMDGCPNGIKDQRWQDRRDYIPVYVETALEKYFPQALRPEEWPDPEPIKAELEPVPPFSADMLPVSVRDWVMDISGRMCVPPEYVAVSLIVVVSSIIGASCRIKPKKHDDWTVVPNLWGGACGYPSDGKSPSFEDVLINSVSRLEKEATAIFNDDNMQFDAETVVAKAMLGIRKAALKDALKKGKDIEAIKAELMQDEPEPPRKRRYRTNNASVEKLGELLRDNPRGILVYRDELVGAFNKWDEDGDRAFYLEGWSGKSSFIDDKIGRGTTDVAQVCLSILGTIQPDRITAYLIAAINGHDNDGFVQRFQLLVFPDRVKWEYVDRKPDAVARGKAYQAVHSLAHADFTDLVDLSDFALFTFDDEAQDLFVEWFKELHINKIGSTDEHPVMVEHLGKYRSLMPSLALIFHLLDAAVWTVDTPVNELPSYRYSRSVSEVSVTFVTMAIRWCEFLEAHARRIYGMATDAGSRAAAILAEKIVTEKLEDGFNRRTIIRKHWKLLSEERIVDDALQILVDSSWIFPVEPVIKKGGRPALTTYLINPKIFQM